MPTDTVAKQWREACAVCFDVDSTVCIDEGIDELAGYLGKKDEVAALTANAMGGAVKFEDALAARLGLMQVSEKQLNDFIAANPPKLSPGVKELVATLHAKNVDVYLVSGGFTQMIHPIADVLGIDRSRVHANTILFDDAGAYKGFDDTAFTSRTGGKPACLTHLKATHAYKTLIMIGDGATDLEARTEGAADMFVGYGGVQQREMVVKGACWFVESFDELIDLAKARAARQE